MENSTEFVSFVLAAYGNIGQLRYLYFTMMILWYISIVFANTTLIVVICMNRRLHEPMYIFLCSLLVNEICGSTTMYPLLMSQMFSDTHEVSLANCFTQIVFFYTSVSVEYCNLAAMAYDRYVSICYPLHYNVIMNTGRVCAIILLVWIYSIVNFAFTVYLMVHWRFCGNVIDKIYCDIHSLHTLACSVSAASSIYGLVYAISTAFVPFLFISFSYIKILIICLKTSKETKQKAISTCTPQIAALVNFAIGCSFDIAQSRLDVTHVPDKIRILLSVYLLICQPIFSPVMYGLNLSKIRDACKRFLFYKK
ncbi:olfactory receptor 11A1-like [Centroberyx affinis]|uniref:olfactory receptor 11A1-like n=1 Tax=Centroberyx affinis TaxID=166261 RepID=UPI003A5BA3C7